MYNSISHSGMFGEVCTSCTFVCFFVIDSCELFTHWVTRWGRVTPICIDDLIIIGSDNGLSLGRRQAIIGTSAGILLIGPLRTNFREILIEIHTFSFKKMHMKMLSGKWRPFCFGLDALIWVIYLYSSGCSPHCHWAVNMIAITGPSYMCWDLYCKYLQSYMSLLCTSMSMSGT